MIARNNELNDLYRKYDSEMNAQHSIDLLHPANPLRSQPHTHPISPQTKVSKEEGEMGFLNVCINSYLSSVFLLVDFVEERPRRPIQSPKIHRISYAGISQLLVLIQIYNVSQE